jgi:hypothetical protein
MSRIQLPLAMKLETCGIFGVSSLEYLSYAKANRNEWVTKGEGIVAGYVAKYDLASAGLENDGFGVEC